MTTNSHHGFILLEKAKDETSHSAIYPLKKIFQSKVGHTGTLDPMATGILVCAIGEATKFLQYIPETAKKTYVAAIQLGIKTDTADITGEIIEKSAVPCLGLDAIKALIIEKFTGKITQTPPIYSALKYKGKPYYHYARKGQSIPIKTRDVNIKKIENIRYDTSKHQIKLTAKVSSGTYIRSLAQDIAQSLGTIGCLLSLARITIEPWHNQQGHSIQEIKNSDRPESYILPIESGLDHLPRIMLTTDDIQQLQNGSFIRQVRTCTDIGLHRLYDGNTQFKGIVLLDSEYIRPKKILQTD